MPVVTKMNMFPDGGAYHVDHYGFNGLVGLWASRGALIGCGTQTVHYRKAAWTVGQ